MTDPPRDRRPARDHRPARAPSSAPAQPRPRFGGAGADRVRQPGQDLQGRRPRGGRAPGPRPASSSAASSSPSSAPPGRARARCSTSSAASTSRRPVGPSSPAISSREMGPREQTRYLRQVIGFVWQQTAPQPAAVPDRRRERRAADGLRRAVRRTSGRHGRCELLDQVGLADRADHRPDRAVRRRAAARRDRGRPRQRARGPARRRADRRARLRRPRPRSSSSSAGSTGSSA